MEDHLQLPGNSHPPSEKCEFVSYLLSVCCKKNMHHHSICTENMFWFHVIVDKEGIVMPNVLVVGGDGVE